MRGMSGVPPEEPTRRLDPTPPVVHREVEVLEEDPAVSRAAILDDLRSLKRAVALLGVLAVAALGVGLWALLTQEEESDAQRGATREGLADVRERVERVENDVEDAATEESVSRVRNRQEQLSERVGTLSDDVEQAQEGGGDAAQAQESVEELSGQVEELTGRIDALEQQAEADGGGDGTDTP